MLTEVNKTRSFEFFLVIMTLLLLSVSLVSPAARAQAPDTLDRPSVPATAQTLQYSSKGDFATLYFSNFSECVYTSVWVEAVDGWNKLPDGSETASQVYLTIDQYDDCTGVGLSGFFSGPLAADAFQIKKLDSTTLNTTVEFYDYYSGNSFPVNINLSWTGTGDSYSTKEHRQVKTANYKLNFSTDGTFRSAGVSGSISDGTTNFIPESTVGSLSNLKRRVLEVYRE